MEFSPKINGPIVKCFFLFMRCVEMKNIQINGNNNGNWDLGIGNNKYICMLC